MVAHHQWIALLMQDSVPEDLANKVTHSPLNPTMTSQLAFIRLPNHHPADQLWNYLKNYSKPE